MPLYEKQVASRFEAYMYVWFGFGPLLHQLDGTLESILGDLVIENGDGVFIIEFKKDLSEVTREDAKFNKPLKEIAKVRPGEFDQFHHKHLFVYAHKGEAGRYSLNFQPYLSPSDKAQTGLINRNLFLKGAPANQLDDYIRWLKQYRTTKAASGGISNSLIACIKQGNFIPLCSVADREIELGLTPHPPTQQRQREIGFDR